jgi:hypothetical protein
MMIMMTRRRRGRRRRGRRRGGSITMVGSKRHDIYSGKEKSYRL